MIKKLVILILFIFFSFYLFSSEKNNPVKFIFKNSDFHYPSKINLNNISYNNFIISKFSNDEVDKIELNSKVNRILIAFGAVTLAIGTSMLLAGLINYFVPFDAVSVNGKQITEVYNVYYILMGVGGGLMGTGIPLIITGSVRIYLGKKSRVQ